MEKEKITTAYILAGGKSTRMGTDKGLVPFQGRPMIEHIIQTLSDVFSSVIIVANNPEYTRFQLPVIPDLVQEVGPLGGIYTALNHCKHSSCFIISCDMPQVSADLIRFIIAGKGSHAGSIAQHSNRLQPLCGVYSTSMLEAVKQRIDQKKWKVIDLLSSQDVAILDANTFDQQEFQNINTPNDVKH